MVASLDWRDARVFPRSLIAYIYVPLKVFYYHFVISKRSLFLWCGTLLFGVHFWGFAAWFTPWFTSLIIDTLVSRIFHWFFVSIIFVEWSDILLFAKLFWLSILWKTLYWRLLIIISHWAHQTLFYLTLLNGVGVDILTSRSHLLIWWKRHACAMHCHRINSTLWTYSSGFLLINHFLNWFVAINSYRFFLDYRICITLLWLIFLICLQLIIIRVTLRRFNFRRRFWSRLICILWNYTWSIRRNNLLQKRFIIKGCFISFCLFESWKDLLFNWIASALISFNCIAFFFYFLNLIVFTTEGSCICWAVSLSNYFLLFQFFHLKSILLGLYYILILCFNCLNLLVKISLINWRLKFSTWKYLRSLYIYALFWDRLRP